MKTTRKNQHADSRLPQILNEAARLFRTKGFGGTSVRDIAHAVGMLPGSLYCHFATKEELLMAVYRIGVERILCSVQIAVAQRANPWERLEMACIAHLDAILNDNDYAQVVVRVRPSDIPVACQGLVELRNQYDDFIASLIKALPLKPGTDRGVFHLMLMGALNWSPIWFSPDGRLTPRAIARNFVEFLRQGQE